MRRALAAVALTLASVATAAAQGAEAGAAEGSWVANAGISGSLRGAYWSSSRRLDDEAHVAAWTLRLKAAPKLPGPFSVLVDAWTHAVGPADEGDASFRAREALVKFSAGPVDVRVGRQITAWGRADGINPTDNLTPRDTTLLLPDDEDERMGTTSAVVSYYAGGFSLTGVWLPEFRAPGFALPTPPGVTVERDHESWPGDQWGARLDRSGGAVDWSASFYRGRDMTPSVGVAANGFSLRHELVRIVGADAAAAVGRFGVRAEGAYVDTGDRDGVDPLTRNPYVHVVAGIDRTWREYLNVNAQYVFRRVGGRLASEQGGAANPGAAINATIWSETRRYQHGATLRIAHQWLRETLAGEVTTVAMAEPYGLLVRARASYALTDRLQVSAGADVMRGDEGAMFAMLRRNSTFMTELRWDF